MSSQLHRWSFVAGEFAVVEEILDFLQNKRDIEWMSTRTPAMALYEFYGIDPVQLEKERRELLDKQRALNKIRRKP